jgi:hypothetical protein
MLEFLLERNVGSARQVRLFAAACCRHACHRLTADGWAVVALSERFADGLASEAELRAAISASEDIDARGAVDYAVADGWHSSVAVLASGRAAPPPVALAREEAAQAELLRCILGRLPFSSPGLDPRWRTRLVLSLAQAAYEERVDPDPSRPGWLVLDPARLLVVADCLEEAGADSEFLRHLRRPGDHVRGCWCVDLILQREG